MMQKGIAECVKCGKTTECVWLPNNYESTNYPYCENCLKEALDAFK